MRNLNLIITDRALERLKEIGPECEVYIDQIGMACHSQLVALVKTAEGANFSEADFTKLEKDGVTIWVPDAIEFENDQVEIDLQGIFFMVVPMCLSALIQQPASGGCEGCSGCCGGY
ncbi:MULTISPECIES: hypothetical protein [Jonquetella]|uniref:FeS cluster biogenesis domain-containing protein n=1 Tax=Jonquetella anthropi DSM 22815 TaxID=885272 RepID=H0UJ21_9BACT|nr:MULTISPECIES: hypothetical protein [Jonquetella]EEX49056.1 hypothetical protein GCWU000246_00142 [Jonquetella anthropi E3_33 E1]EHM13848.1 hypothetical protein JonanDRAFT_1486 [Jonquetella anthropi DSM 22815]ERL23760.1 hypothetical protein HMPREF1249_0148 [Jonquetella sp. BV3C21]